MVGRARAALGLLLLSCHRGAPLDRAPGGDAAAPAFVRDVATPDAIAGTADRNADAQSPAPPTSAAGVRYVGRVGEDPDGSTFFDWPATGFVARFHGTGVTVRMKDEGDLFDLAVDGASKPPVLGTLASTRYVLARGLPAGEHTVRFLRRTEAFAVGGVTRILGVDVEGGELLSPPAPQPRAIEIVGDSITCGYGDQDRTPGCGFSVATENAIAAYGSLTAEALGAELSLVAWSGRGVYRNFDRSTTRIMPNVFDLVAPGLGVTPDHKAGEGRTWDHARFLPDAVVVALGTNDFASGDPGEAFTAAYVSFAERLRSLFPSAHFVFAIGPMLHDPLLAAERARVREATSRFGAAGGHVRFLEFDEMRLPSEFGCDGHPSAAKQRSMAAELELELRGAMGW